RPSAKSISACAGCASGYTWSAGSCGSSASRGRERRSSSGCRAMPKLQVAGYMVVACSLKLAACDVRPVWEAMPKSTIRIMLADDHALVLEGLRGLIEREPDMEVVAMFTDGA